MMIASSTNKHSGFQAVLVYNFYFGKTNLNVTESRVYHNVLLYFEGNFIFPLRLSKTAEFSHFTRFQL